MEAILKYNLDEFDDKVSHMRAVKSLDLCLVISDFEEELRKLVKYSPDGISKEKYEGYVEVREKFYQILNEYSIDMEKLIY
jgi:hypothetical protein